MVGWVDFLVCLWMVPTCFFVLNILVTIVVPTKLVVGPIVVGLPIVVVPTTPIVGLLIGFLLVALGISSTLASMLIVEFLIFL